MLFIFEKFYCEISCSLMVSGGGATRRISMNGVVETPQAGQGPYPKAWTKNQRWVARNAQMQDNLEGGELNPADDVRSCCKNSV